MPIKSYLAHAHDGKKEELISAISSFEACEVIPAQNNNVLIVITDTPTEKEDEILKGKLDALSSLKLLAMVAGFNTPQNN